MAARARKSGFCHIPTARSAASPTISVTIWLAPEGDASRATQLPVGNVGSFSALGNSLAWTADGRIVFASAEGSEINLWMTNADGTNRHALTSNSGINVSPVVSPDGHYIVFSSSRAGQANIWRMTIDGNNATQLTHGPADLNPVI